MRRCIALFALFVCSTASSETAWPLKTPTELKALHGVGFTGFQLLTYRLSELPNQTDRPSNIVIGVGRDIIFRDDGRRRRVVDFRLARIYDVDENGRYLNSPIAAEIVFRDTELANRLVLSKAISGAGIAEKVAGFADPFWRGTELKVVAPNEALPAVEWHTEGGETTAFYKGEEVIRWEPMEAVFPAPVVANLGRVLLWFFNTHPALNARLAADGRAPRHFNVHWMSAGQTHADDYQLIESRWCGACEALSEDMKPGLAVPSSAT